MKILRLVSFCLFSPRNTRNLRIRLNGNSGCTWSITTTSKNLCPCGERQELRSLLQLREYFDTDTVREAEAERTLIGITTATLLTRLAATLCWTLVLTCPSTSRSILMSAEEVSSSRVMWILLSCFIYSSLEYSNTNLSPGSAQAHPMDPLPEHVSSIAAGDESAGCCVINSRVVWTLAVLDDE
jgi:hypothetical protein